MAVEYIDVNDLPETTSRLNNFHYLCVQNGVAKQMKYNTDNDNLLTFDNGEVIWHNPFSVINDQTIGIKYKKLTMTLINGNTSIVVYCLSYINIAEEDVNKYILTFVYPDISTTNKVLQVCIATITETENLISFLNVPLSED